MPKSENLKPWKPGQSGNPGGRPKRDAITTALRDQLAAPANDNTGNVAGAIAAALIRRAIRGDVRAIREIADRTEGRPSQQLRVEAFSGENESKMDLSRLSDEQLRQLDEITSAAGRER